MEDVSMPLPTDESTPPVMKTYFVIVLPNNNTAIATYPIINPTHQKMFNAEKLLLNEQVFDFGSVTLFALFSICFAPRKKSFAPHKRVVFVLKVNYPCSDIVVTRGLVHFRCNRCSREGFRRVGSWTIVLHEYYSCH